MGNRNSRKRKEEEKKVEERKEWIGRKMGVGEEIDSRNKCWCLWW